MRNVHEIKLETYGDPRGKLTPFELQKHIPFQVKRLYFVYDVPIGERRGYHAHYETEQVFLCLNGSVTIIFDDGSEIIEKVLDNKATAVYCGKMVWHYLKDFSENAVFVSLASQEYLDSDYIKEYYLFLSEVKKNDKV